MLENFWANGLEINEKKNVEKIFFSRVLQCVKRKKINKINLVGSTGK